MIYYKSGKDKNSKDVVLICQATYTFEANYILDGFARDNGFDLIGSIKCQPLLIIREERGPLHVYGAEES